MKNKFLVGFLSGLAGMFLIAAGCFTIYAKELQFQPNIYAQTEKSNSVNGTEEILSDSDILKKINQLEGLIDEYYMEEVDAEKLTNGIYKGMIAGLGDPYSTYYTVSEYNSLMESSSGVYYGIGTTVSQNVNTGVITLVKPFVNSPAYEAGLLPGDILYKVEGEEVTGLDLTEVVSRIKGETGTKVNVEILRNNSNEPISFLIERRKVEVPTIEYEMLEGKIGYIAVSEFDEITLSQFKKAIEELDKQGQIGLVIDLRNNPGGLLDTVTKMLDRILPEGLIVYTEDKDGFREEIKGDNKEVFNKPISILINGNSASASEIFAGAIQDYEKGTIVGTTSFGKGIVQSIIPMQDGTALKVTVSKYFTPLGRNIHKTGITPDVEVELLEELKQEVVIDKKKDNQLHAAIEEINKQIATKK